MHGREGRMGSFDWAGPLGSYGLDREGHWALSTQERTPMGPSPSRGHVGGVLSVIY